MTESKTHAPVAVSRRTGQEPLTAGGVPLGPSLIEFWQWSSSDLSNNALRGVLAEYLVALAVGAAQGVRAGWGAFDLTTPSGIRVEVKSSSRWHSWFQKLPSIVQFGIQPTRAWDPETNELAAEAKRQADVYVFAVLGCEDKRHLDPLNCDQWSFYVLPATTLNERFRVQKMLTLRAIEALDAGPHDFAALATAIQGAGSLGLASSSPPDCTAPGRADI